MPDTSPVDIIGDAPESKRIEFGFDAYGRTIAGLIENKNNRTPLAPMDVNIPVAMNLIRNAATPTNPASARPPV